MAQFGRPSADTNNPGGYTDQGGGSSNIYTKIDEVTYDDADYIRSPLAPSSSVYVTKLSNLEDPVSSSGHVLRTRYAKDAAGGATINLVVELRQGYVNEGTPGTLICTRTFNGISETFTTDAYSLSSGEADAITDYTSLYVRMVATQA
jgi:hypothetical protein